MNASATLGISQGHHPANHRSAVPARAYESGSGYGHDAAPAGHPHPPRPPPPPASRSPAALAATIIGGPGGSASRAPAASLRERYAPLDPDQPAPGPAASRARTGM